MKNTLTVTVIWTSNYENKKDWVQRIPNTLINNFWVEFGTQPIIKWNSIVFFPSPDVNVKEIKQLLNNVFENHNSEFRVEIKKS
jgi:hypothetical protein